MRFLRLSSEAFFAPSFEKIYVLMTTCDPRTAMLDLLDRRSVEATVCPSEVARSLADAGSSTNWRSFMLEVHDAVDQLVADRVVQLSWKGKLLDKRAGPYRIRRQK